MSWDKFILPNILDWSVLFNGRRGEQTGERRTSFIQEETLIYGSWSLYQSTIKKRSIDLGSRTFFFIKESIQRRFDDLSVLGVD